MIDASTSSIAGTREFFRYCAALAVVATGLAAICSGPRPARAAEAIASPWVDGHNVRTRLLAGRLPSADHPQILAGVEMDMADGWKTYWRNPGDAGGVPPSFDWSRSVNVARVTVRYPAPGRMLDKAGTTLGYKGNVVFPVLVVAKDAAQPIELKLDFAFGTCREICVPGEAVHELAVDVRNAPPAPEAITAALARVPATSAGLAPKLVKTEMTLSGPSPSIRLHAVFAPDAEGADVFAEGPEGEFLPLPQPKSEGEAGARVYEIDLTKGADVAALKGKSMLVTLVSSKGSSEVQVPIR